MCSSGAIPSSKWFVSFCHLCRRCWNSNAIQFYSEDPTSFHTELAAYRRLHERGLAGILTPRILDHTTLWDLPEHEREMMEKIENENCSVLLLSNAEGDNLQGLNCGVAQCDIIERELERILESLHGIGIIHGDIRESNVFRAEDGKVMLIDFGKAVIREGQDDWQWLSSRLGDRVQLKRMIKRLRILAELQEAMRSIADNWGIDIGILCARGGNPRHHQISELLLREFLDPISGPPLSRVEKIECQLALAVLRWELGGNDCHEILRGAISDMAGVDEAQREEMLYSCLGMLSHVYCETGRRDSIPQLYAEEVEAISMTIGRFWELVDVPMGGVGEDEDYECGDDDSGDEDDSGEDCEYEKDGDVVMTDGIIV
jgi:hypothetical protein